MPANETELLNRCRIVENTARNIKVKYEGSVDERLRSELIRLDNRAREYEHGTFIILVVGPAKSGKSTLVNLIAHDFVSPTGFLKCTVRPSVISRRGKDEDSSLTVYSGTDSNMRIERIDSIIDTIRGFGNDEDLSGVICEKMPLTEENIKRHVQLGLENSLDSENLLSSIRTGGGNLLQDRVFVIDMPGFDGAYQNIDNPVYETIARRADLIIFVQSSNAAFSKVSKEFLNVLAENNRSVPVCLVHNIFDAAWWRDETSKKHDIEKQRQFACDEIRRLGFNIDTEHSFCINLGAVEDYRRGMTDSAGKLEASAAEYDRMEQQMYERIITKRDSMRLNNTLSRVAQQRDLIVKLADNELAEANEQLRRYEAEKHRLESFRPAYNTVAVTPDQPDINLLLRTVTTECDIASRGINLDIRRSNRQARELVSGVLQSINTALNQHKDAIFGLATVADRLFIEYRTALNGLEAELASLNGGFRATPLERMSVGDIRDFDVVPLVNIDNIVPHNTVMGIFNGSHTGRQLCQYIGVVRELFAPTPEAGHAPDAGVLSNTEIVEIRNDVGRSVADLESVYNKSLLDYYNAVCAAILRHILPDPEAAAKKIEVLTGLVADLKKISI